LCYEDFYMRYLACQNSLAPGSVSSILSELHISSWIYLGDDPSWRIQAESGLPPDVERISIASRLLDAAGRLRRPYIDWIGDLSEKNRSPEWWASEIAAKNPYYMLFTRICLLDAAYHLFRNELPEELLVVGGTPALTEELAQLMDACKIQWTSPVPLSWTYLTQVRGSTVRIARSLCEALPPLPMMGRFHPMYQKFLDKHITCRQAILRKHTIDCAPPIAGEKTVLFFSWIDRRSFAADGSYTDPNFGPLPGLYKKRGYSIGFVPRVLYTMPYEEAVVRLKETGERMYFPEQYVTYADSRAALRSAPLFDPDIPSDAYIQGIPVESLAREHIDQTRHTLPDNLSYHRLVRRLFESGTEPGRIVHTCEGHSWENSLSLAVHTHMKKTKVLGYDNLTFSRLALSMYPSGKEMAFKPLPDYIITNGPLFQDTLVREGYDCHRIRCGCALRHTYLWNEDLSARDRTHSYQGTPVNILVATAIGFGDSVELISKAARAFGNDESYQIIIKCHPMVNADDVKRYLGPLLKSRNISFSTSSIGELLPDMDLLLYTYTTVCYEAMMHGVYPIYVVPENSITIDKLDATPDIRAIAVSPDDLRKIAYAIVAWSPDQRKEWRVNARAIVRRALAPVNGACAEAFSK
jgi:hypothetical protein